jgi:hypothetical protein
MCRLDAKGSWEREGAVPFEPARGRRQVEVRVLDVQDGAKREMIGSGMSCKQREAVVG